MFSPFPYQFPQRLNRNTFPTSRDLMLTMPKRSSSSKKVVKDKGRNKEQQRVEAEQLKRARAIASASIRLSELTDEATEEYIEMKMNEMPCYVAPSYVGGNGLYTLGECKRGQTIAEYTGKRIDMAQIRMEENEEEGKYAHEEYMLESFSGSLVIDASVEYAGHAKYANHMCSPNCEFITVGLKRKDGGMTEVIFIKALTNIGMFQEVSVKYNWNVQKNDLLIVCNCKSPVCVGYIAKPDKKQLINKKNRKAIKSEK